MAQVFDKCPIIGGMEFALTAKDIEDMVVSFLEKKGEEIPRGEINIYFDVRYGIDEPHIIVTRKDIDYFSYYWQRLKDCICPSRKD